MNTVSVVQFLAVGCAVFVLYGRGVFAAEGVKKAGQHKDAELCLGSDGLGHRLDEFWYNDDMCQRFLCFKDDEGIMYEQIANCPIAIAEGDCTLKPGTKGHYPDCSPRRRIAPLRTKKKGKFKRNAFYLPY
uniref:U-scoloptoxin(16)-Er4a n=1 Tax=Ethmostigmus rubripes TaxID=62613 RepID=TXG4A_ETHRU|nr:RecName: Full=U-scoloptoxin(16)-Er4a; Short=U-SLPTX(16)-Er4a; Flags: Precursor [Ethmostigmus rubripes]